MILKKLENFSLSKYGNGYNGLIEVGLTEHVIGHWSLKPNLFFDPQSTFFISPLIEKIVSFQTEKAAIPLCNTRSATLNRFIWLS